MAFLQEKIRAKGQVADDQLDQAVMEELTKGDAERQERIEMLYQKFDGTYSRLEKIKIKEQKALEERYKKQLDPKRAEEQRLFELFEEELGKWNQYEEVGLIRKGMRRARKRRRPTPTATSDWPRCSKRKLK